jgi:hypothetical protein
VRVGVWIAIFSLAGCVGSPEPRAEENATAAQPVAAPENRDAEIFAATMARARSERLDTLPIGEVVARIGTWFVGAPYTPATLEAPGPEGLVVNLREFDCVTYVENMLAMARAIRSGRTSFDDYRATLQTIRYRDGKLNDYPSRLHYFSDWIYDNERKGIVTAQTRELGGVVDPEPIDFMTQHRASYRQLADDGQFRQILQQESALAQRTRYMIPESRIEDVAAGIRNGDVIAATSSVKGLDVAHTGLALWKNGRLHLMHAPLIGDSVEISEDPLAERVIFIPRQDGIMVARPQEPKN